ncbi:MAG: signal recognition particle-docking protein FtsY [Arenicellales bacterium]
MFTRLRASLSRTRQSLAGGLSGLFGAGKKIDQQTLDELEELLILADVGVDTSMKIMDALNGIIRRDRITDTAELYPALEEVLLDILQPSEVPLDIPSTTQPFVIMIVGVNGAGKTTSIGKITSQLVQQGKSVLLAAGDTFRAAASEQLKVWGDRNQVHVIAQQPGADAAAVVHDALESAISRNNDVVIIDTAGRQHTSGDLMQELEKIYRIAGKKLPGAPHEVMLVLDAGIGQNALHQLEGFDKRVNVSGLCLTKLDGTAKGGIIISIADRTGLPIRYIGIGEGIDDLRQFNARDFVKALFNQENQDAD